MSDTDYDDLIFSKKLKNILTFDMIRLQKLLEISQNMIIALFCGYFLGYFIDQLFPAYVEEENKPISTLIIEVIGQVIVLGISTYYIKKVLQLIPFLFKLSKSYVPSKKGESLVGINIGLGLIFVNNQTNFRAKLTRIRNLMFNTSD